MAQVLVLDDDPVIADLLRLVLEDAGFTVTTAPTLGQVPADIIVDVILTDLPGLSAYDAGAARGIIARIRERFADRPIVLVTAHADAALDSVTLGVSRVVTKPFDLDDLLRTVRGATAT